jgi:hypothetical protein
MVGSYSLRANHKLKITQVKRLFKTGKAHLVADPYTHIQPLMAFSEFQKRRFIQFSTLALDYILGKDTQQVLSKKIGKSHQRCGQILDAGLAMLVEHGLLTLPPTCKNKETAPQERTA